MAVRVAMVVAVGTVNKVLEVAQELPAAMATNQEVVAAVKHQALQSTFP